MYLNYFNILILLIIFFKIKKNIILLLKIKNILKLEFKYVEDNWEYNYGWFLSNFI